MPDPYGAGWIFAVRPGDRTEMETLLSAPEYDASL